MSLFSVIIPLYNKELQIQKTLESALNQTYKDFELLVINDGSTDRSLELAQSVAAGDARVKIFSKENGGVSCARNFGIEQASNPYIALLDADDFWEKNYLEEMAGLIERYPGCGMYGSAYKAIKQDQTIIGCADIPEGIIDNYFKISLERNVSITSSTIITKDAFQKVGMYPVGMIGGEDFYMYAKVAREYKVAFLPKVLAVYNMVYSNTLYRIGVADTCHETWYTLYRENDFYLNEFIAKKALDRAIRHVWGEHKKQSLWIEDHFKYTQLFKKKWRKLYLLNRVPGALLSLLFQYKKMRTLRYMNSTSNI